MPNNSEIQPVRSIFITNNGLADHIGTAQVLPYLNGLSQLGHAISVLSVEDRQNWAQFGGDVESRARQSGLDLQPVFRPRGVMLKAERFIRPAILKARLKHLVHDLSPDLIHCRSYFPLSATMSVSQSAGIPFVFDMRGFWIDQRIEGGNWNPDQPLGRAIVAHFRKAESRAIETAGAIVVLTQDAGDVVQSHPAYRGAPVKVIPCSVDQTAFSVFADRRVSTRRNLGFDDDELVLVYLGSASGVYRMDLVYRFFNEIRERRGRTRLLMVGSHDGADHRNRARAIGITIAPDEMTCMRVPHAEVPDLLNAADMGLSLYVATPSSLGVSATKVGEYLACGLPVLSNVGVGDITRIITDGENGAVLRDDSGAEVKRCADVMLSQSLFGRETIKQQSQDYFSMDRAVASYQQVYRSLASQRLAQ